MSQIRHSESPLFRACKLRSQCSVICFRMPTQMTMILAARTYSVLLLFFSNLSSPCRIGSGLITTRFCPLTYCAAITPTRAFKMIMPRPATSSRLWSCEMIMTSYFLLYWHSCCTTSASTPNKDPWLFIYCARKAEDVTKPLKRTETLMKLSECKRSSTAGICRVL